MRGLIKDVLLIVGTALVLTFGRGDAQDVEPVNYGESFQLLCKSGSIDNAYVFEGYLGTWDLTWQTTKGLSPELSSTGIMLNECSIYPSAGGSSLGP